MNIWLIQTGEPLPLEVGVRKMRTAILADKLMERGHKVIWWVNAFNHFNKGWVFKKDTEFIANNGMVIKALRGFGYKKNISLSRLIDNRLIALKFKKTVPAMYKPDIIIASTPTYELTYEAAGFAKRNNIPILVDIRDPWPDLFLDHVPLVLRKMMRVLLYKDFQMVKKTMQMADGLIAVTNTFLEWGLNYAGRQKTWKEKVFYHGYKKIKMINNDPPEKLKNLKEILENKFVVLFVGVIAKSYHNPSILLEAAKKLGNNNAIHFIIAGAGEYYKEFKQNAQGINNVTLTGWLNKNEIEFLLYKSKIGVCPSTKAIALPTSKSYAYIAAAIPILSSFGGDIKEIIEKFEIGFNYPPNNVDILVELILKLYEDKLLYSRMSERARKLFDEMFDEDNIIEEYVTHIESIKREYNHT